MDSPRRRASLRRYVYATRGGAGAEPNPRNSAALGTLSFQLSNLRHGVKRWAPLPGAAAPSELLVEASARRAEPARPVAPAPASPGGDSGALPAKQLGRGATTFELCVSLEGAGDLARLVGPELAAAAEVTPRPRYWFSRASRVENLPPILAAFGPLASRLDRRPLDDGRRRGCLVDNSEGGSRRRRGYSVDFPKRAAAGASRIFRG